MSRFPGWTEAAVQRLAFQKEKPAEKKPAKKKSNQPDYVGKISNALKVLGVEHILEYKFLHDRRFRFDIAIPKKKIAIEFEGGIWRNGRHTRGAGYARDVKKYNLAAMHGWRLLRYTTEDTKTDMWEYKVADEIKRLAT